MNTQRLIQNLKNILAANKDGHLDLNECLIIRYTIEALEAQLRGA
jgi:hypothetical protein